MLQDHTAKERNHAIEFYRFLFTCIIFLLHFRPYGNFPEVNGQFNGGYLATEFFFIVSGYLLMGKAEQDRKALGRPDAVGNAETMTVKYFVSRYVRLMPQYWIALVALLVANQFIYENYPTAETLQTIFPEIFALQIFWLPNSINIHLWFVSALMWASVLVYYLILKKGDFYVLIFAPALLLCYIKFMYYSFEYLDVVFVYAALFRAITEIGLGCIIYRVVQYINNAGMTFNKVFMTLAELGLLAVILLVMYITWRDYKDFVMLFLIALFVCVTFTRQGCLANILNNKLSAYLGKISYVMYLNQYLVQNIAANKFPGRAFWPTSAVLILILIAYSAVLTWIYDRYLKALFSKLLRLLYTVKKPVSD